jgi:hypothetical protein
LELERKEGKHEVEKNKFGHKGYYLDWYDGGSHRDLQDGAGLGSEY